VRGKDTDLLTAISTEERLLITLE